MRVSNIYQKTKKTWDKHYLREKSFLDHPDENLVRIFSKMQLTPNSCIFDLGAGNGRHSFYMKNLGFKVFAGDVSENSISMINEQNQGIESFLLDNFSYPFRDDFFDLVICWGVLHYNSDIDVLSILNELKRVLKKGGFVLGSVRSNRDTYLDIKSNEIKLEDLKGGYAKLYSFEELQDLFADFSDIQIGHTERTILGSLDKKISHWIFQAKL